MMTITEETYNGYKNRSTWNVALWIGNDEGLYNEVTRYVNQCKRRGKSITYRGFIRYVELEHERTPDNIMYCSNKLDYIALNEFIRDLAE